MDVSVNVTGMSWNYPCGDGTVILGSCVATSAPDPRMRYRIGYNGAGYTGPVIHKIDETTDAGSTSLSGLVYSNTEVCQGSISFEMQSWEEDQGCCPGAGFCPSDADDAYYDNAAGCLGTGDDNYSGIVNRSFNITGFSVGTFPVTYNLGDATVSFNVTLSYSPLPTPTVANPAPLGCPGNSTTLTVTSGLSQPGNNFVWMTSANDLTTAVETGSTFTTPPLAGTTTYYVAEQQGSCVGPSRAITINMTTPPAAPTATSPVSTCINGQAILTATSTVSNAQFNWYSVPVGGVAIWNGTSFTTPNIGATQAFYVSVTDPSTGCEGSRTQIIVNPDLTISAPTANDIDVCEGTSGTLTATGNGGAMNWYSDAALTNLLFVGNPYTTPTLTTNQTYYIVEDFNGCLSSTGSVDVNVNPKPEAPSNTFEYFCPSESVTLNALPSAPAGQTAQWFSSPNEAAYLNSGNSFEILSVYSRRTVYYRFVDDVTGCASDFATWDVYVYPEVEEPNADNLDLCINQSGVLNASSVSGDIVWYDQDGITELETDAGNIGQLNVGPFATTGTYTYYVQARDANCESGLIPVLVFVASGSPTSPPVATDDEICAGETATLTATGTVGGAMYWYADNALTDLLFIGSPYVTQSLSNTTSFWVAESAGGCGVSTATEVVVTVNTKPQAPDNTSDYFCPSEMVTLNASPSAPAGQTTQWFSSPDESSYLNSGNSFDIFSVYSRRTLYYRFVDDVTGCKSDFATWDVYVYPEVEEPNADNVDLCVNQSGVLNASAVSGDIVWYDQDGITELETDAGNIGQLNVGPFAISGVYTYYVQARDANCESGLVPVTVFVTSGSPVDPPMAMGDEICAGETATLVATGTVGGAMYWYADNTLTDLLFIGSPYITQSLTANTSFWVAESAGDCGVSTPTEVEVTVNPKPATPTADPQTICAGERAVLTAEGSGGDIYWYSDPLGVDLWNIGDEFTTPPLAQYTPYYIFEEDPATGCRSDVGVTWVNVDNFTYVSSATVINNPICVGGTATIKVATTDIFSCVQLLDWNFDVVDEICLPDGDITGNGAWVADFEVGPFDEAGDYIYYVQESDGFLFCPSQQFALVVSVVESPATPVVSDEEICEGASVTLVADDNGDGEIVWYADAGLSTELFIGNEYTVSPTTDLTVWVTRRNGSCASASDAATVTVNPKPATPTADPETICFGESATLTAEGSGGDIYWYSDPLGVDLWNIGDEFTTPPLSQYTPYYIVEEDPTTGCRSDVGVTWVNVDNFSYVSSATVTKNSICEGETTTIKVATTDIFSCVQLLDWNFDVIEEICLPDGDTTGNGAWVADFEVGPFDEPGDYIYYVQESDGFLFCPSQQFSLVVSVVESPATPVVSDEEICEGSSVTLVADDNGDGEIVWYADAGLSTELFIGNEYTVSPTTDLTVWVTRRNGSCASATDAVTVTVNPKPATPTADPETICFGESATLTAEGSGGDIYWYSDPLGVDLWNIGDEFTTPPLSQYTPYYIIEEDPTTGCRSDVGVTWVNVDNFAYVSSATVTKNPICEGETTTIKVATTDIFSCVQLLDWNFDVVEEICLPDGDTTGNGAWVADFEVGPFDEPGDYIYYIQESDGFLFCPSQQFSTVVTVLEAPAAPVVENDTICEGQLGTVRADDNGSGEIVWYWDAALTQEVKVGSVFSFPASVTRSVWAVRRTGDCVSEASMATVVVYSKPATPTADPETICFGESATLTAEGSGGDIYWYSDPLGVDLWNIGDEFTTPPLSQYTPYYIIEEDPTTGCRSDVGVTWVNVDNFSYVSSATVTKNPICEGETTTIKVATTDIFSCVQLLDWNFDVVEEICLPDGDTTGNGAWVADFEVGPFDEPGDYIYYIQESDGFLFCPSQQFSTVVTVLEAPAAPVVENDTICEGQLGTVRADDNGSGEIVWYWDAALTQEVKVGSVFSFPASVTRSVWAVRRTGDCVSEASMATVVVYSKPATPTADPETICFGESATLTAEGSGGDIYWYSDPLGVDLWNIGDEFTTPPLSQYTPYYIIEEDPTTGCRSDVGVTWVNVDNFSYVSSATVTKNPICEGETTTIKVATTDIFSCVQLLDWNFDVVEEICLPDGDTTGNGAWVADFEVGPFDEPGDYIYYIQESDGFLFCPSQQFSLVVTVLEAPAAPVVENDTICAGQLGTVRADDNGPGEIVWYWDAALTQEVKVGSVFSFPASVTRSVWAVRRTGDCVSEASMATVVVNPKPEPPVVPPVFTCAGESATLEVTDTDNGGDVYWYSDPLGVDLWNIGDEFTTPTLFQYTPYYVIREDEVTGCRSDVVATWVTVDNFTYVSGATVENNPVCTGGNAIIKVATTDIFSCVQLLDWNFDVVDEICLPDGDTTGNGAWVADFEVGPFDEPGDYIFYVQESDGFLFCPSQQLSLVVTVVDGPDAPIASNDGPACEGEDVMVTASTVPGGAYLWTGPNGFTTTEQNFVIQNVTTADAGEYFVTVTVGNCTSERASTTVVVYPTPALSAAPSSNSPICEGDTLKLFASVDNPTNIVFHWSGPNGFSSMEQNPTIANVTEVENQGFYTVYVEDTTTGCSSDPASVLVNINRVPTGITATNNGPACEGEDVQLTASYVFGATYEWSGPDGFTSSDRNPVLENVTVADEGVYSVVVSIGDCASEPQTTEVIVHPTPIANAGVDTTIIEGSSVQLFGSGGITYEWSPSDYLDHPNLPNPVATPPIGVHVYTLTVTNEFGCKGTDQVTITVLANPKPETVNLITPNGDGINDFFTIKYLENLDNYTLAIYARGGAKLLETNNYQNDWNGTHNGKDLPDGTYWYVITSGDQVFKGAITIKR